MRTTWRLALIIPLFACATQAPAPVRQPARATPPPAPTGASSAAVGDDIVARTNGERSKLSLPTLQRSGKLMQAAELHARQMASSRTMAHDIPGAQYPKLSSRLAAVSYTMLASGENIAEGQPNAAAVVAGWMTSRGHRENILSTRFTEMGAAVATGSNGRPYYVQVFGRPATR